MPVDEEARVGALPAARTRQPAKEWNDLGSDEQTRLLVEYGHYLDQLPPTCSMETKVERLRRWLAERGIEYRG